MNINNTRIKNCIIKNIIKFEYLNEFKHRKYEKDLFLNI
jgi:hypothetical protein